MSVDFTQKIRGSLFIKLIGFSPTGIEQFTVVNFFWKRPVWRYIQKAKKQLGHSNAMWCNCTFDNGGIAVQKQKS